MANANPSPDTRFTSENNPGGRPKGSIYPREAMRMLSDCTEDQLEEIVKDRTQRANVVAAARQMLAAAAGDRAHLRDLADGLEGQPKATNINENHDMTVKRIVVERRPPSVIERPAPTAPPA